MLLPVQIQSILYHFMMGWMYGLGFSFLVTFIKYLRFPLIKGFLEILYHVLFTFLMFYGLYNINGGITNLYLVVIFMIGVLIYYAFYLHVFMGLFSSIKKILRPFLKKLRVVKQKILAIIRVPKKKMQRRRANVRKRKLETHDHKKKTQETSIENSV